ncbi:30S ribosomal protein S16 [Aeromicrobium endophyticum]|uniref:Small ribosomal subunit protein bS16 n=1 Tax=Aeromicrobium endophyticum TaxID=2292704 RepID=A0A371P318_9ACTN|nr:30S ribosomal protein S16 [Aeromicrobium endophyticum]REK69756.1 30S ribosomal protein S16 [Aeromicrobium endophyticum]
MAVKIRLKRMGKIRTPFYRVVVADSRTKRDGRVIEEIGTYNPKAEPSIITIDGERAQYWLGVGAQPTEAVTALLKITGDIGGKNTMKFADEKRSKEDIFQDALKELHSEPKSDAVTKKAAAKKAEPKADEAKAEEPKAEQKADEAKADEAKADEPAAEEAKAQGDPVADAADEAKA